jgi:hypothetical protein
MKAMDQGSTALNGSWTHSFEEDQAGVRVYRPTHSFAFPLSRGGRETLDFSDDGRLVESAPGPDDRPRSTASRWTALGMNRFRLGGTTPGRVIEVIEATPDVLKLRFL